MTDDKIPTADEIWKILERTSTRLDKTNASLAKTNASLDKTNASLAKTEKITQANAQQLGALSKKWGDMSEALTIGDVAPTLNSFAGIEVNRLHPNVRIHHAGKTWEIDGFVVGKEMVVIIEAKASLTEGHVSRFISKILHRFTELEPEYTGKKIYGAVGYLKATAEAITLAQQKGLLVIRSTYQNKEIVSPPRGFKLRNYHP